MVAVLCALARLVSLSRSFANFNASSLWRTPLPLPRATREALSSENRCHQGILLTRPKRENPSQQLPGKVAAGFLERCIDPTSHPNPDRTIDRLGQLGPLRRTSTQPQRIGSPATLWSNHVYITITSPPSPFHRLWTLTSILRPAHVVFVVVG